MKINDIVNEGPLNAIGAAVGTVGAVAGLGSKLKNALSNTKSASALYLNFKRWARTPARLTDPLVVQQFLRETGFPDSLIKKSADEWKHRYNIPDEVIQAASGTSKRKIPSKITDTQIQQYFKVLFDMSRTYVDKTAKSKFFDTDSFDKDLENIKELAVKYGVKDIEEIDKLARSMEIKDVASIKNPKLLLALATIGVITLKY